MPTEEELFAKMTLDELNAKKPLAPVMFGYDSASISEEGRGPREESRVDEEVVVDQGDGRRSLRQPRHAEYNLALGDQRAAAVKAYLLSLGLAADRVATVSKGEEQPFCKEDKTPAGPRTASATS